MPTTYLSGQTAPESLAVFLRPKFIYGRDDRPKYKTFGEYASRLRSVVESRLPVTTGKALQLKSQESVITNQSQATTEIRPYVEVLHGQIKTTSIKVAEHFGKRHDNVIRAIKTLDCSPEFHALNFEEASYEVGQPNGGTAKYPLVEMTKDGFMFLAMGFTGKEAAKWKEGYITAFNRMESQLLGNTGQLPPPKTKKALPGCLTLETQDEIKQFIQDRAALLPKEKQAGFVISMWSALGTHFGIKKEKGDKTPAYKRIPEGARLECLSLLARLSADDLVTLTRDELAALKALPKPDQPPPTIRDVERMIDERIASKNNGLHFGGPQEAARWLSANGYVAVEKTRAGAGQLVAHHIPAHMLPALIEHATKRLSAIALARLV